MNFGGGDVTYYLHEANGMSTIDNTGDTTINKNTQLANKANGNPWVVLGSWAGNIP